MASSEIVNCTPIKKIFTWSVLKSQFAQPMLQDVSHFVYFVLMIFISDVLTGYYFILTFYRHSYFWDMYYLIVSCRQYKLPELSIAICFFPIAILCILKFVFLQLNARSCLLSLLGCFGFYFYSILFFYNYNILCLSL